MANGQRVDLGQQPAVSTGQMAGGQPMQMDTGPGRMDPGAYLDNAMKSQLDALQSRFKMQWDTVQKNAKYLGTDRANAMLTELHQTAAAEAAQVQADFQNRAGMLKSLQQLGSQGQLGPNPDKTMWGAVAGKEVAEQMFPEPTAAADPLSEYGKLTQQEGRLQSDAEQFHIVPGGERVPSFWKPEAWEDRTTSRLQVFDPDVETRVKKGKQWVREIGAWVDSPQPDKDAKQLANLNRQLRTVREAKAALGGSSMMSGRIGKAAASLITGENPQGTFGDKATASVVQREGMRSRRKLDEPTARKILAEAGGDKKIAEQIARQRNYDYEVE